MTSQIIRKVRGPYKRTQTQRIDAYCGGAAIHEFESFYTVPKESRLLATEVRVKGYTAVGVGGQKKSTFAVTPFAFDASYYVI